MKSLEYFAGLFDGEGYCGIERRKPKTYKRYGYQLRCSMTMTDPRPLELLQKRFGGSFMKLTRKRGKDCWQWSVSSNIAHAFLSEISPYLLVKSDVAKTGSNFQEFRNSRNRKNADEVQHQYETELYEEMRVLNARWGTEYYNDKDHNHAAGN
jgi:hypothetical protein